MTDATEPPDDKTKDEAKVLPFELKRADRMKATNVDEFLNFPLKEEVQAALNRAKIEGAEAIAKSIIEALGELVAPLARLAAAQEEAQATLDEFVPGIPEIADGLVALSNEIHDLERRLARIERILERERTGAAP